MTKFTRLLAAALLLLGAATAWAAERSPEGTWRRCERVVDGDTVLLDGGERVRLIGVDAPELGREGRPDEKGAREAKGFLRGLAEGRRVRLGHDEERRDDYGRTLGYLWLEDGRLANEELIRAGLAEPIRYFPYRMKERFLALARERARGPAAPAPAP